MFIYRIAGKFGGEFNLAVWRLARASPNLIHTKFYIRLNFVGCHLTVEQREVKSERVKTERQTYTPKEDNVRVVLCH